MKKKYRSLKKHIQQILRKIIFLRYSYKIVRYVRYDRDELIQSIKGWKGFDETIRRRVRSKSI